MPRDDRFTVTTLPAHGDDQEPLTEDGAPRLEAVDRLDRHGYSVDVLETYAVTNDPPGEEPRTYYVQRCSVTFVPLEEADAAVDTTEIFVGTCHDYLFRVLKQVDLSAGPDLREVLRRCKHGDAAHKFHSRGHPDQGALTEFAP